MKPFLLSAAFSFLAISCTAFIGGPNLTFGLILRFLFMLLPGIFFCVALAYSPRIEPKPKALHYTLLVLLWCATYIFCLMSWGLLSFIIVAISATLVFAIINRKGHFATSGMGRFFLYGVIAGVIGELLFFGSARLLDLGDDFLFAYSAPAIALWQIAMGMAIQKLKPATVQS